MEYTYFVAYTAARRSGEVLVGNGEISISKKVDCNDDVLKMEDSIKSKTDYANVNITNFKILRVER